MTAMSEWKPTQEEIDRGAEALRQLEQGGRVLRPWDRLPNSDRKKWRTKSEAVIRAAIAKATGAEMEG
jgi:hypothetical protein